MIVILVNNGTSRKTDEIIPIRCLFASIAFSNVVTQLGQLNEAGIDCQTGFDVYAVSVTRVGLSLS
jgi:hypothetical protein